MEQMTTVWSAWLAGEISEILKRNLLDDAINFVSHQAPRLPRDLAENRSGVGFRATRHLSFDGKRLIKISLRLAGAPDVGRRVFSRGERMRASELRVLLIR
jgi:hypothetical protein